MIICRKIQTTIKPSLGLIQRLSNNWHKQTIFIFKKSLFDKIVINLISIVITYLIYLKKNSASMHEKLLGQIVKLFYNNLYPFCFSDLPVGATPEIFLLMKSLLNVRIRHKSRERRGFYHKRIMHTSVNFILLTIY